MQDMLKPAVKGWRRVIRMDRRAAAPRLYVPVQPTYYTRRTPVHDRLIWDGAELLRRSITNHVGPHLRQLILQCIALPTYRF
jgi:hypothetical protein